MDLAPRSPDAIAALCMAQLAEMSQGDRRGKQAPLWKMLGQAYADLGRFNDAIQAFANAVECGAGPDAEAELAVLQAVRGEPIRAAARLTNIISRWPAYARARVDLATLLLAEGRSAEVLQLLQPAPPPGSDGAMWRAQLSFALLLQDRIEAAASVLPASSELASTDILTATQMMRLALRSGDMTAVAGCLDHISALVADPSRGRLDHRIEACFQLGAVFHGSGLPQKAFEHWRLGHRLLAAAQPFSRARHSALLEASTSAFSFERPADAAESGDLTPVFIVGLPRSGTTLAEHILAAHPEVHGCGERMALLESLGRLGGNTLDPATYSRAARADPAKLAGERSRFLAALRAEAPAGVSRIIDKMPANDMLLGFAAMLLPGVRVIHCTRALPATGFSIFRRRLSGYHPYAHELRDLGWYMREQRRLMERWRSVLPIPMIEIALEEWRHDFKGTLARVLSFLGLPYDQACEKYAVQERDIRTASRDQVRQSIDMFPVDRWTDYRDALSPMLAELEA